MQDTLLAEPFEPDGQIMAPPSGVGLGVEIDEDKLRAYGRRWE
jgi:L-alanine-DL-glutamate epimerase-like enolase superfamily enzyme